MCCHCLQPTAAAQPAAGAGQKGPTVAAAQGQDPSNPLNNQAAPASTGTRAPGDLGSEAEWKAAGWNNLVKPDEPAPQAAQAAPAAKKPTFSKSVQDIAKASGIADPNKIKVGQKIKLPDGGEYTVAAGDTLGAIAAGKFKGTAPQAAPQSAQPATPPTPKTADELRGFDSTETKKIQDMSAAINAEKDPAKKAQLQKQLTDFTASIGPKIAARAQANQQQYALASTATAGANAALARAADNAMTTPTAAQSAANLATGAVKSAQAAATPTTGVNTGVAKPAVVAQPGQPAAQSAQPADKELDNMIKNAGLTPAQIAQIQANRQKMAVKVPGGPVIKQVPTDNDW